MREGYQDIKEDDLLETTKPKYALHNFQLDRPFRLDKGEKLI